MPERWGQMKLPIDASRIGCSHGFVVSGQTDLRTILETMQPSLSDLQFGFGTMPDPAAALRIPGLIATFLEEEGLSVVAPARALAENGIAHSPGWARISLTIHSSLAAIGLTAAIASALAEQGISANVVAAYFHDHLFVPWEQRHEAMAVLSALATGVLRE
ncbi:MAG: uncharacterized protein QOH81_1494 [Sphingomonadales bacterium]|nr:uncharacterized protein [Sphingomonadales bacterium]